MFFLCFFCFFVFNCFFCVVALTLVCLWLWWCLGRVGVFFDMLGICFTFFLKLLEGFEI